MSDTVQVAVIPPCDVCKTRGVDPAPPAVVDGRTLMGPWAYMCGQCWSLVGVGRLGTGNGQRLVLA